MPDEVEGLTTPVLLMAMPQVQDPFFHRSVVLLVHHTDDESFGFVSNRPTDISVAEILGGMEIGWGGDEDTLAYFGGPVQPQLGTVMFDPRDVADDGSDDPQTSTEVTPGLRISQHLDDLNRLAESPSHDFRLFLGYAGWGEGQLVGEILRNDWLTAPVRRDLLFSDNPATVWEQALESVGVDPAALPSWSPPAGGSGAN